MKLIYFARHHLSFYTILIHTKPSVVDGQMESFYTENQRLAPVTNQIWSQEKWKDPKFKKWKRHGLLVTFKTNDW